MRYVYNDGCRAAAGYKGSTGDCVTRALAIATGQPYSDVRNRINHLADNEHFDGSDADSGVHKALYKDYLTTLGWTWTPTMGIGTGCTVHLHDGELPMDRLIVKVSRHLVAVIDGVINDTHNCSRKGTRCVYGYWRRAINESSSNNPWPLPG